MNAALAAAATMVAIGFSLSTFDRWLRRRRAHDLAWAVSLALFGLGSGSLWWAESSGWTLGTFRVFYLAGAVLNVPWLALGTVYLLAGPTAGNRVRAWLIWLSGLATGVVMFAPTRAVVTGSELPTGKDVFGVAPRLLAAVGSGVAAIIIVVGAIWSAVRALRRRPAVICTHTRVTSSPRRLAIGNSLIAAGTLILSASGTLAGRVGKDRAFAITLLVGIVVLFGGFLVAAATPSRASSGAADSAGSPQVAR